MKTKLFTLILLLFVSAGTLFADYGATINGIYYWLDETNLTACVNYHSSKSYSGNIIIPQNVYHNSNTYNVIGINNGVFQNCTGVTSVTIPNSVTSIGERAFKGCTGLTSIEIPNSVTIINDEAFRGCSGLTILTIGNSVTSIGQNAFAGCTGLSSVTIPDGVITLGWGAFQACTGLITVTIGNNVESIESWAFSSCTNLTSISISTSVLSIGARTFQMCTSLVCVTIPNNVTSIGNYAFAGCTGMTSIVIGKGVTSIGEYAFRNCTGLTSVVLEPLIPPSLGKNCLKYVDYDYITLNTYIYVPCGLLETYKSATSWAEYASNIKYQTYTITTNAQHGSVTIEPNEFTICSDITLTATTNEEGYYFTQWSDGNTESPRAIQLTQDTTFTAEFSNLYNINVSCDEVYGTIDGENGSFEYLSNRTFEAIPNYGYHFTQWLDGNTDNPRTIILIQDTALTAEFAKNLYSLTYDANVQQGVINGAPQAEYLDEVSFEAIPNDGYHFDRWSDGNTDNPRTITLTKDTAFVAEFAPNQYSISVRCDEVYGSINGEIGSFEYLSEHTYEAIFNYGYHFTKWSDGNTDNPRTITLTKDTAFVAEFAKNTYTITDGSNKIMGNIKGVGTHEYLDTIVLTAIPVSGCHFEQWNDSLADISRTIILTQDTTFIAEFGIDKFGTCGEDNALTWLYNDQSKTLTITGDGALTDNYTYGAEAPTQMSTLIIGDGVTAIGDSAFYGKSTINHLSIGANVATIGNYTFAECRNFDDITCYATIVPTINATTFTNVGNKQYIYLYVPADRERAYKRDTYWGEFDIQIKSATTTTTDEVTVTPTETTAAVTWPVVENAATYELTIKDGNGNVICTLVFNAQGQLTSIAFAAPSRSQQSTQSAGFSFTVTGLDSGSNYSFTINAIDGSGEVIDTKSGSFETTSEMITAIDNLKATAAPAKHIENGQLYIILPNGTRYTATGAKVE